jgi:hypothetical protein
VISRLISDTSTPDWDRRGRHVKHQGKQAKAAPATLIVAALLACLPSQASAASFERVKLSGDNIAIVISGEIVAGDDRKFANIAISTSKAIVLLDSPGGVLTPALEIGRAIRLKGFMTYVPEDFSCASSCALIWLAGSTRLKSARGHIGFHAAYLDEAGRLTPAAVGNALVGRYLTQLDLPQSAVEFVTEAPPEEMEWLSERKADSVGISYKAYDAAPSPPPARVAPAVVRPAPVEVTPASQVAEAPKITPAEPKSQPTEAKAASVDMLAMVRRMSVPVFTGGIPDVRYHVIRPVSVTVSKTTSLSKTPTIAQFHSALWDEARKMGADAVINAKIGNPKMGVLVWKKTLVSGDAIALDP